jgi:hypothetical protein
MNEQSAKWIGIVLVIGVLAAALLLVVNGRLQFAGGVADTDTVGVNGCGIGGEDAIGGGQFKDLAGDARTRGELASSTVAWTAWFRDGESRPVTIAGRLGRCGEAGIGPPEGVYYRQSYSTNGRDWVGFVQDRNPAGSVRLTSNTGGFALTTWDAPAYELIIDGTQFKPCTYPADADSSPYYVSKNSLLCTPSSEVQDIEDGAALRIEMFTFQRTQVEGEGFWRYFAKDEVHLRSALAKVTWEKAGYKVGETACASWRIPTSTYDNTGNGSSPAYFLSLIDMNTELPLAGWDRKALATETGRACVLVTAAMFSNDLSTCQNRLRAELLSPIIVADLFDTAVKPSVPPQDVELSAVGTPPVVTEITFDKDEYREGDTVRIRWTATGNVTKFHVLVHINGQVLLDQDVDGSVHEATARAPITGFGTAQVTAYDRCTPSDVLTSYFTVSNQFPGLCDLFPELAQCNAANLIALAVAVLAMIVVVVVFAFLAWLLLGKGEQLRIPPIVGLLIAVVAAFVTAIVFTNAGYFDGFLGGIA